MEEGGKKTDRETGELEREKRDREEEEGERWTEVEKNKGRRKRWKEELQMKRFLKNWETKRERQKQKKRDRQREAGEQGDVWEEEDYITGRINSATLLLDTSLIDRQSSTPHHKFCLCGCRRETDMNLRKSIRKASLAVRTVMRSLWAIISDRKSAMIHTSYLYC